MPPSRTNAQPFDAPSDANRASKTSPIVVITQNQINRVVLVIPIPCDGTEWDPAELASFQGDPRDD